MHLARVHCSSHIGPFSEFQPKNIINTISIIIAQLKTSFFPFTAKKFSTRTCFRTVGRLLWWYRVQLRVATHKPLKITGMIHNFVQPSSCLLRKCPRVTGRVSCQSVYYLQIFGELRSRSQIGCGYSMLSGSAWDMYASSSASRWPLVLDM